MKCALIIGGSCDIGLNIAKRLKKDYKVIIAYHHNKEIIDGIEYIKCDVKKEEDIKNLFSCILEKYKHIDVLINLANVCLDNSFLNKTKKEFMEVLETNLVGTFLTNKYYSGYMEDGIIINMSSTDGIDTGSVYSIDYSASKAGIICMSRIIANCTSNKVYCICPNWIDSLTTNNINKDYLSNELKRIKQDRLITKDELTDVIIDVINGKYKNNIIRVDVKEGKLWIKEV